MDWSRVPFTRTIGIVMILHPDSSFKGAYVRVIARMHINRQAANVAQVFPTDRFKRVMAPIETVLIHHQGFNRECFHIKVLDDVIREHVGAVAQLGPHTLRPRE